MHNKPQISEDDKRVLYVAFTRAKNDLYFICNNVIFKKPCFIQDKHLIYDNHYMDTMPDRYLSLYLGLRDVNLGFFTKQYNIPYVNTLIAGEKVIITCHNALVNDKKITQFSKTFQNQLTNYLNKGYRIIGGEINFIVAWFDANTQQTYRVVLLVVHLHKPQV